MTSTERSFPERYASIGSGPAWAERGSERFHKRQKTRSGDFSICLWMPSPFQSADRMRIIGTNKHQEPTSGSVSWARTCEKTPNFPINEYWRNASGLPLGTPSPAAGSPPSCSNLRSDRVASATSGQNVSEEMRDFDRLQVGCRGSEVYEQERTSAVHGGAEARDFA